MSQEKYIGRDVHQATIAVAVMDAADKVMECRRETQVSTMVELIQRTAHDSVSDLRGRNLGCLVTRSLEPHGRGRVVCDPRQAARLKEGNQSDRIDARKLAEWLRTNQLKPVYHEEHGIRALRERGRSYLTIPQDVTRVRNRIKAPYRGWGTPCRGTHVYAPRQVRGKRQRNRERIPGRGPAPEVDARFISAAAT
jgi:hypothetical protein